MPFKKIPREFVPLWKDAAAKVVRNEFRVATFGGNSKDKYTGLFTNDVPHGKFLEAVNQKNPGCVGFGC